MFLSIREDTMPSKLPNIIQLNVGGQHYTTSLQTLQNGDHMLSTMFSEKYFELEKDETGSYFIDRDGTHFRYVLNWLRDGVIYVKDEATRWELIQEAQFYQIKSLEVYLSEPGTAEIDAPTLRETTLDVHFADEKLRDAFAQIVKECSAVAREGLFSTCFQFHGWSDYKEDEDEGECLGPCSRNWFFNERLNADRYLIFHRCLNWLRDVNGIGKTAIAAKLRNLGFTVEEKKNQELLVSWGLDVSVMVEAKE
eukprot:Colp12_sorted_trinity150504_noHs@9134